VDLDHVVKTLGRLTTVTVTPDGSWEVRTRLGGLVDTEMDAAASNPAEPAAIARRLASISKDP
jgi:hypothetical protein